MLSCIPYAARRLGFQSQALHSPQKLTLPLRRWIFNPSLKPPPTGPSIRREFPQESRAHVSSEQFDAIRRSNYALFGVIDKDPSSHEKVQSPEVLWATKEPSIDVSPPSPYAGRSVQVMREGDVGLAYNKLQAILKHNNVRRELRLAERHEKKGVKRRRLRSERWKRKFADEVRKKVKLVTEIRQRDRMWGASRH